MTMKISIGVNIALCIFLTLILETSRAQCAILPVCKDGYTHFPHKKMCFKIEHTDFYNWFKSEEACQKEGGHLALLKDVSSNSLMKKSVVIPRLDFGEGRIRYWIGGITLVDSIWIWLDGTDFSQFDDWLPREPNGAGQKCLQLKNGLGWNDDHCSSILPFICEIPEFNSAKCSDHYESVVKVHQCFWGSSIGMTRHDAVSVCRGGELVENDNQAFFEFFKYWYYYHPYSSQTFWLSETSQGKCPLVKFENNRWSIAYPPDCNSTSAGALCQKNYFIYPIFSCPLRYMVFGKAKSSGYSCLRVEYNNKVTWDIATQTCQIEGSVVVDVQHIDFTKHIPFHRTFWISSVQCFSRKDASHPCIQSENSFACEHSGYITYKINTRKLLEGKKDVIDYRIKENYTPSEIPFSGHYFRLGNKSMVTAKWLIEFIDIPLDIENKLFYFSEEMCSFHEMDADIACCEEIYWYPNERQLFGFVHDYFCLLPLPNIERFTHDTVAVLQHVMSATGNVSTGPKKMCPCSCDAPGFDPNPSPEVITGIIANIHKKLLIDKSKKAASKRKKISVMDDREESTAVAYFSIAMCAVPILSILITDIVSAMSFWYQKHKFEN